MQWFRNRPSRGFRLPSHCSVRSGASPTTCTMTSRCLGLLSSSRKTTCCHVPRAAPPSTTGRVRLGPRNVARMWLWPFPSCHRRSCPYSIDNGKSRSSAFGMSSSMRPGSNSLVTIALVDDGVKTQARPSRTPDRSIHFRNGVRDVDRLYPSAGLEWNRLPVSDHGAGIYSAAQEGSRSPTSQPCLRLASLDPPLPPGEERGREGRSPPFGGGRPKTSPVGVGWGEDC